MIRPHLAMITDTCVFWHYLNESSRSVWLYPDEDSLAVKTLDISFASDLLECVALLYFQVVMFVTQISHEHTLDEADCGIARKWA
jgi:hypothetical protein